MGQVIFPYLLSEIAYYSIRIINKLCTYHLIKFNKIQKNINASLE